MGDPSLLELFGITIVGVGAAAILLNQNSVILKVSGALLGLATAANAALRLYNIWMGSFPT